MEVSTINAPSPEYLIFVCPDGRDVGFSAKVAAARYFSVSPDKVQVHKIYGADKALASQGQVTLEFFWETVLFARQNWTTLKGVVIVGHLFCGANPGSTDMHWEQLDAAKDQFAPQLANHDLSCHTLLLHYTENPSSPGVILLDRIHEIITGNHRETFYGWEPEWEADHKEARTHTSSDGRLIEV
ncbi:MAG: hypothetical protein WCP14_05005 [bacterium]